MQNIVIIQRSSLVYLAGAGAENLGLKYLKILHCLGARVPCAMSPSLSRLPYPAEHGAFL